jgi:hypothetical protein
VFTSVAELGGCDVVEHKMHSFTFALANVEGAELTSLQVSHSALEGR